MEMIEQCLWCGQDYIQGMEGCCRDCWEKNQFAKNDNEKTEEQSNFYNKKEAEFGEGI